MMTICAMSSNGFLSAPEITLSTLSRTHPLRWQVRQVRCGVASDGGWYIRVPGSRRPMLLLQHRSFWWGRFALLTAKQPGRRVQWYWALSGNADAWRRLRVHFLHGRGEAAGAS